MQFGAKITIEKATRTGELTANAKSVLSVLGACIKNGDEVTIICDGEDEEAVVEILTEKMKSLEIGTIQ